MIRVKKTSGRISLRIQALCLGKDFCVTVSGGDQEHIGAVALAIPHPSQKDKNKISATVSILAIPGHKEDELAKNVARKIAVALNATVSVSCGIHIDNAETQEIENIIAAVMDMTDTMIRKLI